jgi:hypothetical protein
MTYGILVWLVGALTGIASMPFYMTIATTVVVYWILQALVLGLINDPFQEFIFLKKTIINSILRWNKIRIWHHLKMKMCYQMTRKRQQG